MFASVVKKSLPSTQYSLRHLRSGCS